MMEFEISDRKYDGRHPLLMGILNVTPDSFSDGGKYFDAERATARALEIQEDGADILDIGGESSRPGAEPVSIEDELARVTPVLEAIMPRISIPVSIDTTRAAVAERALGLGASMVNDISALSFDPRMADVVCSYGCPVVLMHMAGNPRTMQKSPHYKNVVEEILQFFHDRISYAVECDIPRSRIFVDPGIGFGKTVEHNLSILRQIGRFHETGCPILIGASRKKMIELITGAPLEERDWGTAALTAWCVFQGVEIQRVHSVKAMRQVCAMAAALGEQYGTV
ncbi:MAG: dihydropteroate synthase [Candidatus Latescibacter sp.]|nr:dihydropteroate synthase [Candidatus Latescibacter sp.]